MRTHPASHAPWYRQAAEVIPRHFYVKSIGTTLFISLFFGAYFYLLKHPAHPITVMPRIWLDSLIGFEPMALPVYLSLWVYVSLPPALLATRQELYGYGMAMGLTCLAGLAIFYVWPTAAPAADIDWSRYPQMLFLKNMDASGNACPSLHVATAFFSAVWLHYLLRRLGSPWWPLLINGAWCGAIVYSTLATRQHVAVDIEAGLLLGGLAAWLSLRHRARTEVAAKAGLPLAADPALHLLK
ncbi:MAG: phosphatase PAP2 family protein [Xanthomonadaceae bacterium]|nr:phosphatase PAP2 family protein [Xanthomonadaceae bacterium]